MTHKRSIRWGRIVLAALVSEVGVIALLIILSTVYRYLLAPGRDASDYQRFNDVVAYYTAAPAAGLAVFLGALWATQKLTVAHVANGVLVGVTAIVLSGGFVFFAKPEDRLMYGVSFVLRILGGYLGGVVARRVSMRRPSPLPASAEW